MALLLCYIVLNVMLIFVGVWLSGTKPVSGREQRGT